MNQTVARRGRVNNQAQTDAYAKVLAAVFEDWLTSRRAPVRLLTDRLQDAATANFQAAFLRGKRQALPKCELTAHDRMQLAGLLATNRQFLDGSLREDIEAKIARQRLEGTPAFADVVRQAFRSRIVDGYGGVLWKVTEAGFMAGQMEIKQRLARMVRSLRLAGAIAQEDDSDDVDPNAEPEATDDDGDLVALAAALGLTAAELLALGDQLPTLRVGLQYEAANDGETCDDCREAADGGDGGEGIYFDEPCPLPGDGICSGNCRCVLSTVYAVGLLTD